MVCDLISEVTAQGYGPVIFPRIQPLGPAHPLGEGAPQGRRTRRGVPGTQRLSNTATEKNLGELGSKGQIPQF